MQSLTVVICTFNRAEFLTSCLNSLCKQAVSSRCFELIVIDNNSTDNTASVAQSFSNAFQNFQYHFEAQQGLSHARNRGVREAAGDWVAFLDDDAVARPDWVEKIFMTIKKDDFDLFGGVYTAWHVLRDRPKWFSSEWETNISVSSTYTVLDCGYPSGGNCVYRRQLILENGLFPTDIGMRGSSVGYGEETALIDAMRQGGAVVGFVPELIIDHCVVEHKYSLWWRLKRSYALERDSLRIWNSSVIRQLVRALAFVLRSFTVVPAHLVLGSCKKKAFLWQEWVLGIGCLWAKSIGILSGICRNLLGGKC